MDKILKLYTYVDGVNDTPFPQGAEEPIEIGSFRYDAKRMGGAPTITASVNYPSCLDDEWTDNVYAKFNREKYYLKQTPTSSYNNESTMYKHDLELVSERVILDNVYFFDAVVGNPQENDKPVSNSTKVVFFGNVREFADRLNASLEYSGLDYTVDVDDDVNSEEKLMSFEDQFFSNVLQEIYNTYEVPYYFDGKTIRIGYSKAGVAVPEFSYGVDDALLSITKNNANYKIVNRATGMGSTDNLPFYYPNPSPKGYIEASANSSLCVEIVDYEKYSNAIELESNIEYKAKGLTIKEVSLYSQRIENGVKYNIPNFHNERYSSNFTLKVSSLSAGKVYPKLTPIVDVIMRDTTHATLDREVECEVVVKLFDNNGHEMTDKNDEGDFEINLPRGEHILRLALSIRPKEILGDNDIFVGKIGLSWASSEVLDGWFYNDKEIELEDVGLRRTTTHKPSDGEKITQRVIRYVKTSKNLLPSIYRETYGAKRFYNAVNEIYPFPFVEGYELKEGEYVGEDGMVHHPDHFEYPNPYTEGHPKEHIITVDDLKPTIKETVVNGLRIDMFSEFAYDENDNDETYEDEDGNVFFKHPYFFGKLRKMDFNLFDHAIENQPMTISFTSGNAGACNFEIGVTEEYPQKNPVQVDENGNLIKDDNGMVLCGCEGTDQVITEYQDSQQDTLNNEVWIALRKEEETYGILMPAVAHRPRACTEGQNNGDTFVILGINLPQSYITNAEKKLKDEIIKYLKENNDEKFTFSISFSRIYFEEEENKEVLKNLSENSRIAINYNGQRYDLYVTSFSYTMSEGDVLPEIRVELDDTLKVSQNALQNAINALKGEIGRALSSVDVVGAGMPYFLRKDVDDEVNGNVNFTKGIKFGEGGKVEIFDNNSAKLTIEYLEVTKGMSLTALEIQEKTHAGGQILVTPAAAICGEVEEFDDYYRCYFQTKGEGGDVISNGFLLGDQVICQTYNTWVLKYYWRKVVGVGEDYVDLSKTDCDSGSDAPSSGDKMVQLGHATDKRRQNAIVIAAYGEGSPYIIQYKGINSYDLSDDKIVTKLSSTENIFTGKVHMELGSDGFENLGGSLNIGNQNMLRNSGFTGDYLSEPLADNRVMDAADELFSAPFDHWTKGEHIERVELPDEAASGYGVQFPVSTEEVVAEAETLSQELYYPVLKDEAYVLSFKAKGVLLSEETNEETGEVVKTYNTISYIIGNETKQVVLTDEWVRYTEKIVAAETSKDFAITASDVTLCEIQLERGTIATGWGNSPWDNSSDRAYVQSIAYLANALEVDAMTEGATDVVGGLILTNHIKVGNYANHTMIEETAGMNGAQGLGKDTPAFWAGGDFDKAIATAQKYKTDTETPEGEAPYVVTHGGKVVLNDAVVRGKVYAEDGVFNGDIYADNGVFGGFVKKKTTRVTNSNLDEIAPMGNQYRIVTPKTVGSLMYITNSITQSLSFELPTVYRGVVYQTSNLDMTTTEVREMVGSEIIVYNESNEFHRFCGYAFNEDTKYFETANPLCFTEGALNVGGFVRAVCKLGKDANGYEVVYWSFINGSFE